MEGGIGNKVQRRWDGLRSLGILSLVICLGGMSIPFSTVTGQVSESSGKPESPRQNWQLVFETRVQTGEGSQVWVPQRKAASWAPARTAVIVCDTWDYHHSINAVRRLTELAPRMNQFVSQARSDGATIIHAPSDCMETYAQHPARLRALAIADSVTQAPPPQADDWNHGLPAEQSGTYPVDQSDGGEDDDPAEHAAWAKQLEALGRNPSAPWKAQSDLVPINAERDLITDRGSEVWKILQSRGIDQVVLVGVHTNMCVLGRPFGLRQLKAWGKQVALVSDLTDTMYNPARWPFVSHFAGTDLVIEYIQQYVCPTITSEQLLGGKPFRFAADRRPTLALLISEDEYQTRQSLPEFVQAVGLRDEFRVVTLHGQDETPGKFIDLSPLAEADLLLVSVRRLPLPLEQLEKIQQFVRSGKPVVGIRTASHAFAPREPMEAPAGWGWWPEFDAEVIGGNYSGHFGNELRPAIQPTDNLNANSEQILQGCDFSGYESHGSLYRTSPLSPAASVILRGQVPGAEAEPVAWNFVRSDGGRTFYTSLGHPDDFRQPAFRQLLLNGIRWAAGVSKPNKLPAPANETSFWKATDFPGSSAEVAAPEGLASDATACIWLRCFVKFRRGAPQVGGEFNLGAPVEGAGIWLNGVALPIENRRGVSFAKVESQQWCQDDANLVVLRIPASAWSSFRSQLPTLAVAGAAWRLAGKWQFRLGAADEAWIQLPLPPRFGGSADVLFQF